MRLGDSVGTNNRHDPESRGWAESQNCSPGHHGTGQSYAISGRDYCLQQLAVVTNPRCPIDTIFSSVVLVRLTIGKLRQPLL